MSSVTSGARNLTDLRCYHPRELSRRWVRILSIVVLLPLVLSAVVSVLISL